MSGQRIVVFTGNLAYSVRKGIDVIDRAIPGLSWLILVHAPTRAPARLLRNQWFNLKRNGWRWIPYQGADVLRRVGERLSPAPASEGWSGRELGQAALARRPNVTLKQVPDLHADTTLEQVRAFAPTLGLSLAAPILRAPLFTLPTLGTLNLHKGKVPEYRGMPPAFWELAHGEASVGCTIHQVEAALDTGAVVLSTSVPCPPHATVRGMQLCLDELGVTLMRDAVQAVLHGTAQPQPQLPGGATHRKPTLRQSAALDARLADACGAVPPLPLRAVKAALGLAARAAWALGAWRVLAPRVTVLLYHRVSDDARDNLTVGIAQFDRQMAMLAHHCHVLSLEQVLGMATIPRSRAPQVCVTFDDGYLDNYTNAAAIMLRHEIPGAFFVSTGLIGTERIFPHDIKRGNAAIPMMDWPQLRQMRADGFTIGSHSVNHIDCAAEPEALVRAELVESRDRLRAELGLDTVLFAYPYGGRHHMTAERLAIVKELGYGACLAAYGGINVGAVDPFNVLRRGIHWEFSDSAFRTACLGLA